MTAIVTLPVMGAAPSMAEGTTSAEPASGAEKPPLQDPRHWSPGHMGEGGGNAHGAGNACGAGNAHGAGNVRGFLRWHTGGDVKGEREATGTHNGRWGTATAHMAVVQLGSGDRAGHCGQTILGGVSHMQARGQQ